MPIYEYRCQQCDHIFESLVRNGRQTPSEGCPECGSTQLTKLISTFAVARNLAPCGTPASDAPASCGLGTGDSACSTCCRLS